MCSDGGGAELIHASCNLTLDILCNLCSRLKRLANGFVWLFISTFGNSLAPSSQVLEISFCIVLVIGGLVLFMLLIGNIQACFHQHFNSSYIPSQFLQISPCHVSAVHVIPYVYAFFHEQYIGPCASSFFLFSFLKSPSCKGGLNPRP